MHTFVASSLKYMKRSAVGWVVILIIALVMWAQAVRAQDFQQAREKHYRYKYRHQIQRGDDVCTILRKKKRKQRDRQPVWAGLFRKKTSGYRPQAEVDPPDRLRSEAIPRANER